MRNVAITGATSFLGQGVIKYLQSKPVNVFAIIRPESKNVNLFKDNKQVTVLRYRMDQTKDWAKEMPNIDSFFHFGWDGVGADGRSNQNIQDKNVNDAVSCMYTAAHLKCRNFLFAGSQAEYGQTAGVVSEQTVCKPIINYGKAKLSVNSLCEPLAKELGINYYHTRIFSVYGQKDHPWALIPSCITTLCDGKEMHLTSCTQYWNYLHVEDAARALCELTFSGAEAGIYNVASTDTRPLKEFVKVIFQECGSGSLHFGTYRNPYEKPVNLQPDIRKLQTAIGFFPMISFEHGISELICQYRKTKEEVV